MSLGYDEVARVCLTHSFNVKTIDVYVGNFDTTEEETELIKTELAKTNFEPYGGFGQLKSLQVQGEAVMVESFSDEYLMLMEHKKIPVEAMKKLPQTMNLIKVVPTTYDYLDSDLKKDGFGSRQHLEVIW